MLEQMRLRCHRKGMSLKDQAGSGVMNSSPKQKPLRDRTMAGIREGVGVSNSISSRSPGLSRIPAYNVMPPSLISVPRPSTTVVEKPFDVTTRTGRSTGWRSHRRVLEASDIIPIIIFGAMRVQITKVKSPLAARHPDRVEVGVAKRVATPSFKSASCTICL